MNKKIQFSFDSFSNKRDNETTGKELQPICCRDVRYWNHLGCKGRQQHEQAALQWEASQEPARLAGQCPQWQGVQSHSAQTRGTEQVWWQQPVTYNMWWTQDWSLNMVPEPKSRGCLGRGPRWAPHSFFPQLSSFHRGLIQGYTNRCTIS